MLRCARIALFVALAAPAASAPSAHASFKDFRDWLAACDNLRNCSAFAVNSEADDAGAYLRVDRGGAADAPVIVTLSVELRNAKAYTVAFDDSAPSSARKAKATTIAASRSPKAKPPTR